MIDLAYPRDLVMTAAIFGVAAFVWSGWAQERPPAGWVSRAALAMLGLVGIVMAAVAIPAAVRHWSSPTAIRFDSGAWRVYLVVVAIEVVACAALAVWANVAGRGDLIAPLILAVVGIHFLPLAAVFGQPIMAWAGGALTLVAVVAAVVPASGTARSFWCGIVGAPIFLIAGGVCLVAGIAELRA